MVSVRNGSDPLVSAQSAWPIVAAAAILSWHGQSFSADQLQATWLLAQAGQAYSALSRDPVRTTIERLSEHEIKAFYVRCSQEVVERRLDGGEAMICSISYDVLLNKHFAGNFDLLLAWSRAQHKRPRER